MLAVSALLMLIGAVAVVPAGPETACGDVRVEVRAPNDPLPRRERAFSARRVQDLELVMTSQRPRRHRALELWLYTPKGYLYQALPVPTNARPGARWLRQARVTLPVNGTLITVNGLYGRWRVEPHLDRAAQPCGPAAEFRLRP